MIDYFGLIDETILLVEQHYKELLSKIEVQKDAVVSPISQGSFDDSFDDDFF